MKYKGVILTIRIHTILPHPLKLFQSPTCSYTMKDKQNLRSLSDSELDDLIMHGIQQQENHPRHGNDYQHYLNVVAAAKEEKARRGVDAGKSVAVAERADAVSDNKVEDPAAPNQLHIAPKGKDDGNRTPKKPKSAEGLDEGVGDPLPGVSPAAAKDTPENQGQGNAVTSGK